MVPWLPEGGMISLRARETERDRDKTLESYKKGEIKHEKQFRGDFRDRSLSMLCVGTEEIFF